RSQVFDNGVDFRWLELVLEAGHTRCPAADDLAHGARVSVQTLFGKLRTEQRTGECRLAMTDTAGLLEQPASDFLPFLNRARTVTLLRRRLNKRTQNYERKPKTTRH